MDEFQYQMYLSAIESRKGTKKPLTDLIKELFELSTTANVYKFKLITYAASLCTAKSPLTIHQNDRIISMAQVFCNSKSITSIELQVILKYYDSEVLYFRPNSVSDLSRINEYFNIMGDENKANVSFQNIQEFNGLHNRDLIVQLYIQAVYPNSKLLQQINNSKGDMPKAIAGVQHLHEVLSTILNHHKELQ